MKKNKPGNSRSTGKGFSPFKEGKSDSRKPDAARPFARFEKKPKEQSDDAGEAPFKRKSFGDGEKSDKKPFGERKPFDRKGSGERRSFGDKDKSDRKPYGKKSFGDKDDRKPYGDRDKKPFEKKSFGDRDDRKPYGDREKKPFEKKSFGDREDRKPYGDREKKPFEKKSFGDREDRKPYGDREKKPFEKKSFGDREERKPYGDREKKPFEKKSFGDREERKPYGDREKKPFEKKSFGDREDRKPYGDREKKPFEKKSFGDKDNSDRKGRKKDEEKPKSFFGDIWASDKPKREDLREQMPDFSKHIDDDWTDEAPYEKEGAETEKGRRPEGKETRGNLTRKKRTEKFLADKDKKPGRKRIEVRDKNATKEATDEMPLNKYLAHSGLCSRRKAVDYIKDGKVTVNGVQVLEPATKVTPKDLVKLNDKKLTISKNLVYVLLNKPKGYITTTDDPEGRQTVMELVADATDERVFPVGRLDRNTSGLLLLTNDGDLAQKLAHPKHNIKKIYHVGLDKPLTKADFEKILAGVELEDGVTLVDALGYVDSKDKSEIGIEIHSGKNRIVRRIFEHLEYKVEKLDRVMYAGLTKKNVNRGRWRFLTEKEVILLKHFK
ncbi:pseudouridine synthase [uncultured Chitinophaga sp.]|uniref:pseudouridine synthase n=1 Tax=uncultured Chitinophaga sp. TaxID=339340 RepID=UPI0025FE2227|nr:pseudouridine synthase [uncultured Chitinophaga sp.]